MPDSTATIEARAGRGSVRFDFGAADAAADELLLTAQALLEAAWVIEHDIPVVTDDWTGRFREVFDVESAQHDAAMQLLAEALLSLSAQVRAKAIEVAAAWTP